MAFLLLLHQKMRLQRKENQLTLKQLRFSSQVDRMQKKVDKRQKYYDKLRKQLERQANCYKNSMNMQISNMFGLGMNSVNLYSPYGTNGAAQQVLMGMSNEDMTNVLGGKFKVEGSLGDALRSGGLAVAPKGINIEGINEGDLYNPITNQKIEGVDPQQAGAVYQQLQQFAQMRVSQIQSQAQNMKASYENNVSIWLEAQEEQLEAQQEYEMDILAEEQADMEAEKASIEVQLQRVQEEKKNVEQALGQAIQDSAPKFGLA